MGISWIYDWPDFFGQRATLLKEMVTGGRRDHQQQNLDFGIASQSVRRAL